MLTLMFFLRKYFAPMLINGVPSALFGDLEGVPDLDERGGKTIA